MRFVGPWFPEHKIGRDNLARRVPRQIAGGDRENPRRRVGQSRPRRRRVRAYRPHDHSRPERIRSEPRDPTRCIDETTHARLSSFGDSASPTVCLRRASRELGTPRARAASVRLQDLDPLSPPEYRRGERCDRRDARALHGQHGGGRARRAAQARRARWNAASMSRCWSTSTPRRASMSCSSAAGPRPIRWSRSWRG